MGALLSGVGGILAALGQDPSNSSLENATRNLINVARQHLAQGIPPAMILKWTATPGGPNSIAVQTIVRAFPGVF